MWPTRENLFLYSRRNAAAGSAESLASEGPSAERVSRCGRFSAAITRGRGRTSRGEALPCRAQALVDRSETLVPLAIRVPGAAAGRGGCRARVVAAEQLHLGQRGACGLKVRIGLQRLLEVAP